jgi:ribosome-binding factor A
MRVCECTGQARAAVGYLRPPAKASAMESIRQSKVNSLLHKELAAIILLRGRELLPGGIITVTGVRVTPDLSVARVYLSFFPSARSAAVLSAIKEHSHALRGRLGKAIGKQMRVVPDLVFFHDDSLDRAEEIDRLLKQ